MKLTEPENKNYAAIVTSIKEVIELEGCDNVQGTPLFGFQGIISKNTAIGEMGIVFPAETQLSEEYARENNLHRHDHLNRVGGVRGYLEDNRRVKAMKFRGHRSDCLFMPLTSLSYIKGLNISSLKEGDVFDSIGDHEICRKYQVKRRTIASKLDKNKEKVFKRVDEKLLPQHYDTENYFRNVDVIPEGKWVYITQKLHGTSIRVGHTVVARQLTLRDRAAKKLGVKVQDFEVDYVFGSRRAIKDIHNPNQEHYYETDIWTTEGQKLEGLLPENFIVYGELVGWTPEGAAIQKGYTYQIPHGECELYIYRVAFVNSAGFIVDLTWPQVREFCKDRGLKTVPELYAGPIPTSKEITDWYIDKRYREEGYAQAVPLEGESPVDEGVCIRVDGLSPYILKAKSPQFLQHETKMLDQEAVDMEEVG